jgi:sugar phosphate permease
MDESSTQFQPFKTKFFPAPPTPAYKWLIVGMLWWISFFNYADRQAIFSVFPLLRSEMNLSDMELGMLGSSFAWVYGLCAPCAGLVVDRVRRKTAILGGLHAWSLICMATALSQKFRHLVFFRAAEGIGETFYYPASMSMLSDYHGTGTRSTALGFHQTSVYAGTIGGGYLAGLFGERYGWRWPFVVFGGLGIVLGLVLHRFLREPRRGAADQAEHLEPKLRSPEDRLPVLDTLRLIWSKPTVWFLMLAFMCAMFVNMVLLAWMPDFLYRRFDLSLAKAGWSATFYAQVASMLGAALGGVLADLLRRSILCGRSLVQALAMLAAAPCVYACAQAATLGETVLLLSAWGLCKGVYDANIFAAVYEVIPPAARGTTAGFMNMLGWLGGGASAPLIIGYLAQQHGLAFAVSASALVYVLSGICLLLAGLVFLRRDLGPGKQ